jgi:hypothetical protein
MKKVMAVAVAFLVVVICLASSVLAGEKISGLDNLEINAWKPTAEVAVGIHSKYLNEASGALSYDKAMSNQSVMVGLDKNGTGLYFQAENFAPFEKEEFRETDFYVGFYMEVVGMKFDAGYGRYWVREVGELDYHAVYVAIDFPTISWQIVPFVKAEYDFAKKLSKNDEFGNISEMSMNGLMYYGGLKREFKLHERVNLIAEVGVGGHAGVYGMPAENLAYSREKVEILFSLTEQLTLKVSALTQQNLGKSAGIANDTKKLFAGAALVWTF